MKLVIYQTSDLHGYVYPTNYISEHSLGLLKIGSHMLEDEKRYDASLKIDCGDLVQGSLFAHYLAKHAKPNHPIIQGMEAIGYDAYVLGNHEFNYGLTYLTNAYKPVSNKIINANIEGLSLPTKPYQIFDVDGFKIGCIGLTTSYIPNWEKQQNIEGLTFLDPVSTYGKYEPELTEACDLIIVCYHGGFERSLDEKMVPTEKITRENQGSELLETFNSIDILLSGHQHRSFVTTVKGVVCAQPKHNGQSFTKIIVDTETKDISYELVEVKNLKEPINQQLQQIFEEDQAKLHDYVNQIIGHFDQDITIKNIFLARLKGHPFLNFLHQVQLEASSADFSAASLFDQTMGFTEDVSIRDVIVNYPFPNTLKVLKITGHQLKEAIEKSATYFVLEDGEVAINQDFLVPKKQSYNYDTYGGLTYVIDLQRPMNDRVISMKRKGKEISLDSEYTIALNNYRATNTSVYPCYQSATIVKEINKDISDLIIDYLQTHQKVMIVEDSNFTIQY